MFRLVGQFEGFLFIQSEDECLILPSGTVERARNRFERKSQIRKPVAVYINQQCYIFTLKEWEHGQNFALLFQMKFSQCDIFKLYQWESINRHKNRLRQQKMISSRAITNANAALQKNIFEKS